ncbi:MAG: hypothetical protein APU95_06290 [Hadesarchaea archaeon YNP_N21]|jgi:hypothetical protein|nr:MAG: hypothetical protein APU95_06290 [Hadesarchaea archaeon YNP_N21]
MRMRALITCEYSSASVAKAISSALTPDNLPLPKGIKLTTLSLGKKVISKIEVEGRVETFLGTIDDLLSCTSVAESVISK